MANSKVIHDALLELRALSSQSVGSENGTAKDIGPTGLVKAVCVVTAVGSGATLTLKLQGSNDNSTFYDIPGTNFLDPTDGAVIDKAGMYEVFFKTDFRYVRHNAVVATDSITHQILITKPLV